jgi:hypothetical protein
VLDGAGVVTTHQRVAIGSDEPRVGVRRVEVTGLFRVVRRSWEPGRVRGDDARVVYHALSYSGIPTGGDGWVSQDPVGESEPRGRARTPWASQNPVGVARRRTTSARCLADLPDRTATHPMNAPGTKLRYQKVHVQ